MRYLAVTFFVIVLAGCASARHHAVSAPFVKAPNLESTGQPAIGTPQHGSGELVQFIPRAEFGIGIVLTNRAAGKVVVTDVRAVEPLGTRVHQIGTILRRWQPFTCPPGAFCPVQGFDLRPFDAAPRAVAVEPGKDLAVALGFRLSACTAAARSTPRAPSNVLVTFRLPGGASQRQIVPLGSARLIVRGGCSVRG